MRGAHLCKATFELLDTEVSGLLHVALGRNRAYPGADSVGPSPRPLGGMGAASIWLERQSTENMKAWQERIGKRLDGGV